MARPTVLWMMLFFILNIYGCGGPLPREQVREFDSLVKSALNYFFPKKIYEVSTQPPTTRVWGTSKPTFSIQELKSFRDLLEKKQFDTLTKTASDIQAAFENDPAYEYKVYDFFNVFAAISPQYQDLLDAWVAYAPAHFAPYLARAHYYYTKAWQIRGHAFASETTSEQFNQMNVYLQKADRDIDSALSMNPRLLKAYTLRIGIYSTEGHDAKRDAAFNAARAIFPTSFLLYSAMLQTKIPRWGGSYAEMERIATEALKYVGANPEMYMLLGKIYEDQAWAFKKEKQYDKALTLCSKAISYGEHRSFFEERARVYYEMQNYGQALEDINRSIALRPTVVSSYRLRASIYIRMEDVYNARQDIRLMAEYFAKDDGTDDWMKWAAKSILYQGHKAFKTDLNQAVSDYDMVIEIDPRNDEALFWRGMANSKLGKMERAFADLSDSIGYNPRRFEAYRMMDYILARQGKWEEIIDLWNRFIALEPNNANAYFERAGTYRHKGDMKNALEDVARACNLGNAEACKIHKQN